MVAEMRIQGKRKRGRPKKRWMDTVKDDMLRWGLSDEDVDDRIRWYSLMELGALQDRHPTWIIEQHIKSSNMTSLLSVMSSLLSLFVLGALDSS